MPTYVYKFTDTDETIEVQQSFTDPTLTEYTHPETGAVLPVKKVFLPVGVTFKGDGFYKTDSRSSSKKAAKSSTDSSTGDSSTSSAGASSTDSSSSSASKSETKTTTPSSSSSSTSSSSSGD